MYIPGVVTVSKPVIVIGSTDGLISADTTSIPGSPFGP
jgi:hypothetical protein